MQKEIMLAVALLVIGGLPLAQALNCNQLDANSAQICNLINNLNATNAEKEALTTFALYQDRTLPNYDFVALWNTGINVNEAPFNTSTQNKGIIKNAWIKILSVMPSVIENDQLYCDNQGKIQSAYDYGLQLPTGTASGDCKTNYALESNTSQLNVFVNNILTGHDKLSSFSLNVSGNLDFIAQLNIDATTRIDHYKNVRYCCRRSRGMCTRYCNSCDFSYTERKTDSFVIQDVLTAKTYPSEPIGNFSIINQYNGATKGVITANNYTRLSLSFENASYQQNLFTYDFIYGIQPYNIITLRATPAFSESSDNINIQKINNFTFNFIANNINNCEFDLFTHFDKKSINCTAQYIPKNISIKTNQFYYFTNDTIIVNITPRNLIVNISYGNESILAKNNASFIASPIYNKVIAAYQDESTESLISVTEKGRILFASEILFFFFFNYVLFSFLTRSRWLLKWLNVDY